MAEVPTAHRSEEPPARPLRFALFGTGFWARFQMAGWNEVGGVECVALYNRTIEKAESLARSMQLEARIYDNPSKLLEAEQLDFVDIATNAESHPALVQLGASCGLPVICQKPMAPSLEEAEQMVETCRRAGVSLYINENWRWQAPIRRLKQVLAQGIIGRPYRARLRMASAFPVFDNQPFLRELEQFLLVDMGSHILDTARFLFGDPDSLYCSTMRVQAGIRGEDSATVVLKMKAGTIVTCEMAYAGTPMEVDRFPQTFAFVEGEFGSIELASEYRIRVTTSAGTEIVQAPPERYTWADPCYAVVHASIVPCQADLLAGLRGEGTPETTGDDNLRTMRLVYLSYESARRNEVIGL